VGAGIAWAGAHAGHAGSVDTAAAGRVDVPLRSWRALRDAGVVRQAYDYSCGAAALASLLVAIGEPTSERDILLQVFSGLTDEQSKQTMQRGLSLLDLKRVAQQRRLAAEGYRVPPRVLESLTRPVLVRIAPHGYAHFVVLRGLRGGRAYLADPAHGNVRMSTARFLGTWQESDGNGVVFVVEPRRPSALAVDSTARPELGAARQLLGMGNRVPLARPGARFP
jgi:predicted double-glycine peptidase